MEQVSAVFDEELSASLAHHGQKDQSVEEVAEAESVSVSIDFSESEEDECHPLNCSSF